MIQQAGIIYLEHESFQLPESLGGFKMFVSPYAPVHLGGAFMPKDLARKSLVYKIIASYSLLLFSHME